MSSLLGSGTLVYSSRFNRNPLLCYNGQVPGPSEYDRAFHSGTESEIYSAITEVDFNSFSSRSTWYMRRTTVNTDNNIGRTNKKVQGDGRGIARKMGMCFGCWMPGGC